MSLLLALPITALFIEADDQKLLEEARSLTKAFVTKLKPELLSAIENGGLASAVSECSEKAPQIAADLSEESGWQVSRASLKPRNANTATPDGWERAALAQLESMKNEGADPETLEVHELTDRSFRPKRANLSWSLY